MSIAPDQNLQNWIPEKLIEADNEWSCRWVNAEDIRFTEPFFDESLSRCRWKQQFFTSSSEKINEAAAQSESLQPAAFIFHVSRCGSTLFSQLLGLNEKNIALSEVPLLDQLLRSSLPQKEELFKNTLRILGRPRFGEEKLFVKLDSWHIFFAKEIRKMYPDTPFILLYRSPEAVLASHRKMRGMHMIPGLIDASIFGIKEFDPQEIRIDQFGATVLASYYQEFLELSSSDPNTLLVNYAEGFPQAFLRAMNWAGISFTENELEAVSMRCGYHSKRPVEKIGEETHSLPADLDLSRLQELYSELLQQSPAPAPRVGTT